MMCMFQVQEEELGKEYTEKNNNRVEEVLKVLDKFFKRN